MTTATAVVEVVPPGSTDVVEVTAAGPSPVAEVVFSTPPTPPQTAPSTPVALVTPPAAVEVVEVAPPPASRVVEISVLGPTGPPGRDAATDVVTSSLYSSDVALSASRVVRPGADGGLRYADASVLADALAPLWLTMTAASAGEPAPVVLSGRYEDDTWSWVPDLPLFLGYAGKLTQSVPQLPGSAFSVQVGYAVTPTVIYFAPKQPLELA